MHNALNRETFIALRAAREAHQIAREIIHPPLSEAPAQPVEDLPIIPDPISEIPRWEKLLALITLDVLLILWCMYAFLTG